MKNIKRQQHEPPHPAGQHQMKHHPSRTVNTLKRIGAEVTIASPVLPPKVFEIGFLYI
jgi:hypothetical protein